MPMFGANPEQLADLGRQLQRQIDHIETITSTVQTALGGTTWVGPAREHFEAEWSGSFRQALTRLSQAFDTAGRDCQQRATELTRVMG
ncbi:MAG: WXG100 family type VII secretion target [Actinomycetes bacterium]|jgi:uncharacterized protein YukE|uniref:Unannotated protein n=1 Tax=freshwater metagenome TaxID=449393 RepID=A0A6J6BZ40_9ZZZZ|nr:hypothetical protein [Actinomycetota bacterium]